MVTSLPFLIFSGPITDRLGESDFIKLFSKKREDIFTLSGKFNFSATFCLF